MGNPRYHFSFVLKLAGLQAFTQDISTKCYNNTPHDPQRYTCKKKYITCNLNSAYIYIYTYIYIDFFHTDFHSRQVFQLQWHEAMPGAAQRCQTQPWRLWSASRLLQVIENTQACEKRSAWCELSYFQAFVAAYLQAFVAAYLQALVAACLEALVAAYLQALVAAYLQALVAAYLQALVAAYLQAFVAAYIKALVAAYIQALVAALVAFRS